MTTDSLPLRLLLATLAGWVMALSRKFIELHDGKIWVKSQVGTGSTFTFTIPIRRDE